MEIVIPDEIALNKEHLEILKSLGDVTVYNDFPKTEAEIIKRTKNAEIITSNWLKISSRVIDNAKMLKYIVVAAVGYDLVDAKYAAKRHIKVLNCPVHNSEAVANLTLGFILALTRKVKSANKSLEEGRWEGSAFLGIEPSGKTLCLIGYGNVGKRVARYAKFLGMKVVHANSKTPQSEVDELVKSADIVSLHLPLNEKTKYIMNERRIRLMKMGSYLINVSRGGLVDQKALIAALKSRHLAGAALDVFENEPQVEKASSIPSELEVLAKMDNVIATPHMAYNTKEAAERLGEELIADIRSCVEGKPINVVN